MPTHPARELDRDLKAAGIPKKTADGKIDFHAARVAYINLLVRSGTNPKDIQALARHSTLELTMMTYARSNNAEQREAVDKLGEQFGGRVYAYGMHASKTDTPQKHESPCENKGLGVDFNGGGAGNRTRVRGCYASVTTCVADLCF